MVGNKSASAVRAEAARRATEAAEQRERDGDPEGAGVLRELARDIRAIRIEGAATDRAKADHMTSPSDTPAAPDVGEITREWFERKVALEGDLEIGAGVRGKRTMTLNLTPEELAALEALAGPDWKSHALAAEAALASSAAETARLREERDEAAKLIDGLAWLSEKVTQCIDPGGHFHVRDLRQSLLDERARAQAAERENDRRAMTIADLEGKLERAEEFGRQQTSALDGEQRAWLTERDARLAAEAEKEAMRVERAQVVGWLRVLEPHLDAAICYASDLNEHPPNRAVMEVREFLTSLSLR